MSKPSSTNCPKVSVTWNLSILMPVSIRQKNILGGYGGEETPDPIPNSEAKLTSADGTAYCGRVGRRRPSRSRYHVETFFCVYPDVILFNYFCKKLITEATI